MLKYTFPPPGFTISVPRNFSDAMLPPALLTDALTMPLSRITKAPRSSIFTGAVPSVLWAKAAVREKTSAAKSTRKMVA